MIDNKKLLDRAAKIFSALGDPARLSILLRLREKSYCVNELAELENAKIGCISARLKILYQANLVKKTRDGQFICYSLSDEHIAMLLDNMFVHINECSK